MIMFLFKIASKSLAKLKCFYVHDLRYADITKIDFIQTTFDYNMKYDYVLILRLRIKRSPN